MGRLVVIYDSASGNTARMARAIGEGAWEAGAEVLVRPVQEAEVSDVERADGLAFGSGAYNYQIMPALEVFLEKLKKLNLEGRVGAAFGSFGWSTEIIGLLNDWLRLFKLDVVEGVFLREKPDEKGLDECRELGRRIAEKI